jgi:hypothetical protein
MAFVSGSYVCSRRLTYSVSSMPSLTLYPQSAFPFELSGLPSAPPKRRFQRVSVSWRDRPDRYRSGFVE